MRFCDTPQTADLLQEAELSTRNRLFDRALIPDRLYTPPPPPSVTCPFTDPGSANPRMPQSLPAPPSGPRSAPPSMPFCSLPSLQVGDQILEVNGRSFLSIPHDEAVRVLKSSRHLMMTVKDVGRLPHARTVVGETKWIASSLIGESSANSSVVGDQESPFITKSCPDVLVCSLYVLDGPRSLRSRKEIMKMYEYGNATHLQRPACSSCHQPAHTSIVFTVDFDCDFEAGGSALQRGHKRKEVGRDSS
ncbi:unnamed protein product [Pleuronectes platessa]|uniref:PDZ domain-containing protein n=1 Tax=Pleuronectes platessa TaxID=8262 RepID=A0A9N7YM36_PLEPL|nr:unnamed protein product [Pleuronectes platessa]